MTTFARLREPEAGIALVECSANRQMEKAVDPELLYFVLSEEVHEKLDVDYGDGEMLIYSPKFETELSCAWVAQTSDFDFFEY